MNVIFSHGLESGPWGTKIRRMADIVSGHGFTVDSIDYTDTRVPQERAARLIKRLEEVDGDVILVGSSMGGYVSLAAAEVHPPKAMFLLAPAIYLPGYPQHPEGLASGENFFVHGWRDEVIPVEHSIRFCQPRRVTLHLLDGDHRLIEALDHVCTEFEGFLQRQLA